MSFTPPPLGNPAAGVQASGNLGNQFLGFLANLPEQLGQWMQLRAMDQQMMLQLRQQQEAEYQQKLTNYLAFQNLATQYPQLLSNKDFAQHYEQASKAAGWNMTASDMQQILEEKHLQDILSDSQKVAILEKTDPAHRPELLQEWGVSPKLITQHLSRTVKSFPYTGISDQTLQRVADIIGQYASNKLPLTPGTAALIANTVYQMLPQYVFQSVGIHSANDLVKIFQEAARSPQALLGLQKQILDLEHTKAQIQEEESASEKNVSQAEESRARIPLIQAQTQHQLMNNAFDMADAQIMHNATGFWKPADAKDAISTFNTYKSRYSSLLTFYEKNGKTVASYLTGGAGTIAGRPPAKSNEPKMSFQQSYPEVQAASKALSNANDAFSQVIESGEQTNPVLYHNAIVNLNDAISKINTLITTRYPVGSTVQGTYLSQLRSVLYQALSLTQSIRDSVQHIQRANNNIDSLMPYAKNQRP